ncbi:MAG: AI-2E family transporter [Clostridiales bacterium]|jgi:predicted PurR-regulated permease PerM|nr:AI-2E family transporter [Clostridiales bacterium]
MKHVDINKKYLEISLYTLAVILLSVIFGKIIWNIAGFGHSINNFLRLLRGILAPFIFGFFIAYFMNSTMRYLERVIFRRINWFHKRTKLMRMLAVTLTYLIFIGCLFWICSFLIPEVAENIQNLWRKLPTDLQYYQNIFYEYLGPESGIAVFLTSFNISLPASYNLTELMDQVLEWVNNSLGSVSDIINALLTGTMNFANTILNFILGMVIAFYMLCDKEHYAGAATKLIVIMFKKRFSDRFIRAASESNRLIEKFIIGKAIDSLIISIMFFAVTLIIKPPYALLLTLIVGITNMIPYFGPLVGTAVSTLIVLPTNPSLAPLVLFVLFVIQQFDGMYLGPKILGDSTGLPPMLVIFAIIVGGALAGVPGMFFGVPIFAIIRNLVSPAIDQKYNQKQFGGGM